MKRDFMVDKKKNETIKQWIMRDGADARKSDLEVFLVFFGWIVLITGLLIVMT